MSSGRKQAIAVRNQSAARRIALTPGRIWPGPAKRRAYGQFEAKTEPGSDRMSTPEDICVVLNAASGRGEHGGTVDDIIAAFRAEGCSARVDLLRDGARAPDAARAAQERGHRVVVAAGGDGTIAAVAGALAGRGGCMGILPLGTFNYFARSLGLPETMEDAVQVITHGAVRPTRLARINDTVFLNNASLGAYPAILREREQVYRRWGRSRAAAYWSVIRTLVQLRRPLRATITADGETRRYRTQLVFAVNNAFQLNELGLQGADEIARGRMVVFIAPDQGRVGMLRNAVAIAAGRAERHRNFEMMTGADIRVEVLGPARSVACDGERRLMQAPFALRVWPEALDIMVPEGHESGTR